MPNIKLQKRIERKERVRKKIFGTPERPRLSVYRSLRHIYAQLIDDLNGKTVTAVDSLKISKAGGGIKAAEEVGKLLAQKAKSMKIEGIAFDRNGFKYHGAIKALADAARQGGLKF